MTVLERFDDWLGRFHCPAETATLLGEVRLELVRLQEEVRVDDHLLDERNRLLRGLRAKVVELERRLARVNRT